jgi:hypothetical protein
MLIPTSPGNPDANITALCQELEEAAAPFDTSASVIPQTHSDPPSDEARTGTTETVPPAQKEREDLFSVLIDPLVTVKKSNMLNPQQLDPLQPVSLQDWIDLIQCDPVGFHAILMATVAQGIVPAAPAPAPAQPATNAPRPILFCSNKADTPWQHEYVSGTTIGATIRMEARKAFIPKPWQPPMNNVMVKMVNNFLDCIRNKCKDLAIYQTQIIQIRTADGELHNFLSKYNNIKLSNVCDTIWMLHNVKDDNLQGNCDRLLAAQMIAWDQIFCNSIMNSAHHDTINTLSALPQDKDEKDLLLLSRAMLLYHILMHIKVVLLDSMLAVECVHQKRETALARFAKKCQDIQKLHEHITSHLKSINNVPPPLMTTSKLKAYQQIHTGPNWSLYVTTLQNKKMTGTHHMHVQLIQWVGKMYANLKEHELTLVSANEAQAAATKATTLKKSGAPRLDLTLDGDGKTMLMKMITDSINEHVTKTIAENTVYKNDRKDMDRAEAAAKTDKKPCTPAPMWKFEKKQDTIEKKVSSATNKYVWCPHHKKDGVLHSMYCKMSHDCNIKKWMEAGNDAAAPIQNMTTAIDHSGKNQERSAMESFMDAIANSFLQQQPPRQE